MRRSEASPDYVTAMESGREMRKKSFSELERTVDAMIEAGVSTKDQKVLESFKARFTLAQKRDVSQRGKPESIILYNKLGEEGGMIIDKETGRMNAWFKNEGDVETFMGTEGTNRDDYEVISSELSEDGKFVLLKQLGALPKDFEWRSPSRLQEYTDKVKGVQSGKDDLHWMVQLPTSVEGIEVRFGVKRNDPAGEDVKFMDIEFNHQEPKEKSGQ